MKWEWLPWSCSFKWACFTNKEIHKYRTRHHNSLHLPIVNLSKFNKGAYFSGKKVFNHLLEYIKNISNDRKCFITTLKGFLYRHAFFFFWLKNILIIRKTEKYKSCVLYSKYVNINTFLIFYCYMKLCYFCCISLWMHCMSFDKYP